MSHQALGKMGNSPNEANLSSFESSVGGPDSLPVRVAK
jgi:hypothetical protein